MKNDKRKEVQQNEKVNQDFSDETVRLHPASTVSGQDRLEQNVDKLEQRHGRGSRQGNSSIPMDDDAGTSEE